MRLFRCNIDHQWLTRKALNPWLGSSESCGDQGRSMAQSDLWRALHINPDALLRLSETIRAWIAIILGLAACIALSCMAVVLVLLVRLGNQALFATGPGLEETAKNFVLAFATAFGGPFLVWRTWVAHRQATAAAEQARISLENHFTGIYSKSVE